MDIKNSQYFKKDENYKYKFWSTEYKIACSFVAISFLVFLVVELISHV